MNVQLHEAENIYIYIRFKYIRDNVLEIDLEYEMKLNQLVLNGISVML